MKLDNALDAAEDRADAGDLSGAIADLEALGTGLDPGSASRVHCRLGALLARAGRLDAAIEHLKRAVLLAGSADDPATRLEATVTHASILGALGQYDAAIPMLGGAVKELESRPELAELSADAKAELRAYLNLVSPKSAATWASLLA